jgi:hypothetical protein
MQRERYDEQFTSALDSVNDGRAEPDLSRFEHAVWSEIAIRGAEAPRAAWFSSVPTPALAACCVAAIALGSLIGLSKAQAYDRETSLSVERRYVESIHPVMMSADHSQHQHQR